MAGALRLHALASAVATVGLAVATLRRACKSGWGAQPQDRSHLDSTFMRTNRLLRDVSLPRPRTARGARLDALRRRARGGGRLGGAASRQARPRGRASEHRVPRVSGCIHRARNRWFFRLESFGLRPVKPTLFFWGGGSRQPRPRRGRASEPRRGTALAHARGFFRLERVQ